MHDIYTPGDFVSNVHVDRVVRAHKECCCTNKDAIIPIFVKERHRAPHTVRALASDLGCWLTRLQVVRRLGRVRARRAHVRVPYYEPVIGYPPKAHASIPREILAEDPEADVCNDSSTTSQISALLRCIALLTRSLARAQLMARVAQVVLSRTCKIGPNTLVGGRTQITMGASVHASGIGQCCVGDGWHGGS
ncbi:hypothetical protein A0H81_02931 [Grifola frondosa]|uniref:Uncharacterized protein n=1 Tax=Grifola frondosa TaxID=5627 RepID=A0A1C7MHH5_GRIFR|nr:hypothetical protein A0H81_02931 [Grifola frondosa]